MRTVLNTLAATILLLLQISCDNLPTLTKGQYLTSFEKFVAEVEANYSSYGDAEWQKSNARYTELSEALYYKFKSDLTADDLEYTDRLKGRYRACQAKYKIEQAREGLQHLYNQGKSFIEHVTQ